MPTFLPEDEADPADKDGHDGPADVDRERAEIGADFEAAFGPVHHDEHEQVIAMSSKLHLGWQTSYRNEQPEKKAFKSWRLRFSKMRARHEDIALQAPRWKKPKDEQAAVQQRWLKRKRRQ